MKKSALLFVGVLSLIIFSSCSLHAQNRKNYKALEDSLQKTLVEMETIKREFVETKRQLEEAQKSNSEVKDETQKSNKNLEEADTVCAKEYVSLLEKYYLTTEKYYLTNEQKDTLSTENKHLRDANSELVIRDSANDKRFKVLVEEKIDTETDLVTTKANLERVEVELLTAEIQLKSVTASLAQCDLVFRKTRKELDALRKRFGIEEE